MTEHGFTGGYIIVKDYVRPDPLENRIVGGNVTAALSTNNAAYTRNLRD